MLWLLALALLSILFLPVRIQTDIYHSEISRLRVYVGFAGFHKTWMHQKRFDARGLQDTPGRQLLALLHQSRSARSYLLAHLRIERLDVLFLLHTADAARSALLSTCLQWLATIHPYYQQHRISVRILPDFFRPRSTLMLRCIIRPRLGTLLLTAGLLILHTLSERQPTESEAT